MKATLPPVLAAAFLLGACASASAPPPALPAARPATAGVLPDLLKP